MIPRHRVVAAMAMVTTVAVAAIVVGYTGGPGSGGAVTQSAIAARGGSVIAAAAPTTHPTTTVYHGDPVVGGAPFSPASPPPPTTTTTTTPPPPPPPVAGSWPPQQTPAYRTAFAIKVLNELGAPYHPNAVTFLVAWAGAENCRGHNPFCRKPDGVLASHPDANTGARVMAATLWEKHPARPPSWGPHYPAITAALHNAAAYVDATEMVATVATELRKWCGRPSVCGDDDGREHDYPTGVANRARHIQ